MNAVIHEQGIGPAPARLTEQEARCWDEIVLATPPGVLLPMHRVFLEQAAVTLGTSPSPNESSNTPIARTIA